MCKRRARRVRAIRKTGYATPDVRFPTEGVDDEPGVPADSHLHVRHWRRVLDHKVQSCMHMLQEINYFCRSKKLDTTRQLT